MQPNIYLFIIAGVLTLWIIMLSVFVFRMLSHYKNLTAEVSKKDLISSLNHLISASAQNTDDIKILSEKLLNEIEENKAHLQKIGFKRYNPFTDTGGDQSFTLSILDDRANGIVISSLHSRENTRIYAKRIESGKSENQVLSTEEQEVIKQSLK